MSLLPLLVGTASAADDPPYLPLGPTEWFSTRDEAEGEFAALVLELGTATSGDTDAPGAAYLEAERTRAAVSIARSQVDRLDGAVADADAKLTDAEGDLQGHAIAVEAIDQRAEAARAAVEEAARTLATALEGANGAAAERAKRALAHWRAGRQATSDAALAQPDVLAALAADEQALRAACQPLGGAVVAAVDALTVASSDDLDVRLERARLVTKKPALEGALADAREERDAFVAHREEARERLRTLDARLAALGGAGVAAPRARREEALAVRLRALDAQYGRLLLGLDALDAPLTADAWCAVFVHGGLVRVLVDRPSGVELLRTAAAARSDVCAGTVAPLLSEPVFLAAWADAALLEADEAPARAWFRPAEGEWYVDGVLVDGIGTRSTPVHPGLHRVELRAASGELRFLVEDVRAGENLGVWASGAGIQVQPLSPADTGWGMTSADARSSIELDESPRVDAVVRGPADGEPYFATGLLTGGGWLHHRAFGGVGVALEFDPAGRTRVSVSAQLLGIQTAEPVFLSRWEPQSRLTRASLAARWTVLPAGKVRPWVELGAFGEPDVAFGPWAGVGARLRAGAFALDLGVSTPFYIPERGGTAGVEVLLQPRLLAPLHTSPVAATE